MPFLKSTFEPIKPRLKLCNTSVKRPQVGSGWQYRQDVPAGLANLGPDSVEEWYWRVNKAWLLAGLREGEIPEDQDERREEEAGGERDAKSEGTADVDISE